MHPTAVQSAMQMHNFDLKDRAGTSHSYSVMPHPGMSGFPISMQVTGLVGPALLKLVLSAVQNQARLVEIVENGQMNPDAGAMGDLVGLLFKEVDGEALLRDVGQMLLAKGSSELVLSLMEFVWRDGKPLKNDVNFDVAFAANYTELYMLIYKVVVLNGFFPADFTSESATEPGPPEQVVEALPREAQQPGGSARTFPGMG